MPDDGVPGLPFFNQEIPKLQGVPDFTDRSHMWADYTKDGYCVRSIVGFDPNDFEFVVNFFQDILQSRQLRRDAIVALDEGNIDYADTLLREADQIESQLSDGIRTWDLKRIKDIIGKQEEIMDECYKQLKVIVETRDNIVFSRLPFRYIYSLYRCLMYNALVSTMVNALSVERILAQPVACENGRRVERDVGRAKGTFGQMLFIRALFNNMKVHRGLAPEPQGIWRRYFSYVVLNQDKTKRHMRYKHPNLSITPQNLSIADGTKAWWLDQMSWMTGATESKLSGVWASKMAAQMRAPLSGLVPPRYITTEDLYTKNEKGLIRTTRLESRRFRTRTFSLRTRSCSPRISHQETTVPQGHRSRTRYVMAKGDLPERLLDIGSDKLNDVSRFRSLESWETSRIAGHGSTGCEGILHTQSFVVVGWFPGNKADPKETCIIFLHGEQKFLRNMYLNIMVLRGWRSIFSFKTVQGFGLYECQVRKGAHEHYTMSPAEATTLAQFFHAYNRGETSTQINKGWEEWCQINLSGGPLDYLAPTSPCESQLSLKLILKWSQWRLVAASLVPLVLSFIIGMWYHLHYNDPQSAWSIASWIGSSGAFIIALLAVLTQLKDG